MSLLFSIAKVSDIIPLRHEVLRKGKPIETCHFNGDGLTDTFHFKAVDGDIVVGCASFMRASHPKFDKPDTYQLRGMAVSPMLRGNNIGAQLLSFAETYLKSIDQEFIWCNVRKIAIPFYAKQNYIAVGDMFEIKNIGPHILMYKNL